MKEREIEVRRKEKKNYKNYDEVMCVKRQKDRAERI